MQIVAVADADADVGAADDDAAAADDDDVDDLGAANDGTGDENSVIPLPRAAACSSKVEQLRVMSMLRVTRHASHVTRHVTHTTGGTNFLQRSASGVQQGNDDCGDEQRSRR